MIEPDYVHTSGREDLPLDDRVALLEQAILNLERGRPAYQRGAPWEANGAVIHLCNETIGYLRDVISGVRKGRVMALKRGHLSAAECRALAWNRGGYDELSRVKEAQRGLK